MSGGVYHVIARGIERKAIFRDAKDHMEYLRRLSDGLKKAEIECHAWALIANHFHLLLIPAQKPISQLMQSLLTGYTLYFNRRHNRAVHLFQNRYKSILCVDVNWLFKLRPHQNYVPINNTSPE